MDSESLSEGESGRTSDKDDDDFDEDIEVVHGAEPYRFEPLAPERQVDEREGADVTADADPVPPANLARLSNTDW